VGGRRTGVGGRALLAIIAAQALEIQATEEGQRSGAAARARVLATAERWAGDLPMRLASAPFVWCAATVPDRPALPIPDQSADSTGLMAFCLHGEPARARLLTARVNAGPDEAPFWELLLARRATRDGDVARALASLQRLASATTDFRLTDGLSLQATVGMMGARRAASINDEAATGRWLAHAAMIPAEPANGVGQGVGHLWPPPWPAAWREQLELLDRAWTPRH